MRPIRAVPRSFAGPLSRSLSLALACLALAAAARALGAQVVPTASGPRPSSLAAVYRVNFAIPDAPAFELLAVDPATILRPQSVRELALGFASFRAPDGSLTIPRAFAIELSPGLLVRGGDLRVRDYNRQKLLYALRLSGAVLRDSTAPGASRLAFGARMTLVDEADFRTDTAYAVSDRVTDLTASILAVYLQARRRVGPTAELVLLPDEEAQIERLNERIRERWAARYWNADVAEIASAVRAATADSAGRDPRIDAVALWGTYAKGLGRWGQGLLGVRLGAERDSLGAELRRAAGAGVRLYAGSNRYKGFAEAQQQQRAGRGATWLANAGFELAVASWLWATFSAGVVHEDERAETRVVTSFVLKTGVPEFVAGAPH